MAEDHEGDVSDFSEDEDELIPLSVDPTLLQNKSKKRKEQEGAGEGKDSRPTKRARSSKSSSSSSSAAAAAAASDYEEKEDSDSEERVNEIIQVDFDFFDPKPSDHYTLRVLLKEYLDTEEWHPDALATLISEQVAVGTMIKAEGEDQPFGFITAINLKANKTNECIKAIRKYLLSKCDPANKPQLTSLLSDDSKQTVGLLIHERVINLPAELAPPLHDALLQDIAFAQADTEAPVSARNEWKFDTFVMLTRCFHPLDAKLGGGKKKKGKASTADAAFYKFEDEFYQQESLFSCAFPVKQTDTQRERQTGVIMAIKANKVAAVVKKLHALELS